jgi:hypothetical protein
VKKVRIITLEYEVNHNQQEKEEFVDVELCHIIRIVAKSTINYYQEELGTLVLCGNAS